MAHLYMHLSTETIEKTITDLMLVVFQSDCWTLLSGLCLYCLMKPEQLWLSTTSAFVYTTPQYQQLHKAIGCSLGYLKDEEKTKYKKHFSKACFILATKMNYMCDNMWSDSIWTYYGSLLFDCQPKLVDRFCAAYHHRTILYIALNRFA